MRNNRRSDRSVSCIHNLDISFFVDSVVHSLTNSYIRERLQIHIQSYISHDIGVCCHNVDVVVAFDRLDLVCRHRINHICFACLKHSCTGSCLRYLTDGNGIYGCRLAPVIFILLERGVISLFPFCTDEGTGSYRMVHDIVAVLFQSGRADDTELCQTVDERGPCLCKLEYYRIIIRTFHALYTGCLCTVVCCFDEVSSLTEIILRIDNTLVVCLYSFRVEICSVVELHTLTEMEGVCKGIVGNFPGFCKLSLHFLILIKIHKHLIASAGCGDSVGIRNVGRVHGTYASLNGNYQIVVR